MRLVRWLNPHKPLDNEGERLVPGVSHDLIELVRHRNSYVLWRNIIEHDIANKHMTDLPIRIADLGSGVGHGCATLAEITNSEVVGVEIAPEAVDYARKHYAAPNIIYVESDLHKFIEEMTDFDYVVSRAVLEHIPDGLALALRSRWRMRLMVDVPYDEAPSTNRHHLVNAITEESFAEYPNAELLYQDGAGFFYDTQSRPTEPKPYVIMCLTRSDTLPSIESLGLTFPHRPWYPADDDPLWEWHKRVKAREARQAKRQRARQTSLRYKMWKITNNLYKRIKPHPSEGDVLRDDSAKKG